MNIWSRISKLSIGQLFKLSLLFLSRPLLIIPTIKATKRAMQICNLLFGESHHSSNKENAFRHALWNVLICQETLRYTKNKQKSVFWAQKVTDLYEKVTKNELLDKKMDLQNNAIGRVCFLNHFDEKEEKIIKILQFKAEKAVKVDDLHKIIEYKNEMIYISE